jgi:hypothetical protein
MRPATLPASIGREENRCIYAVLGYDSTLRRDFQSFCTDEFNLRSFDLSPGLGFSPSFPFRSPLSCSAAQMTWSGKSFLSLVHVKGTEKRAQTRPIC